jgi:hypothetical protein
MNSIGTMSSRLSIGLAMAPAALGPVPCQAATAALPWDYTLIAMQDTLTTYIAPAAIGLGLSASIVSTRWAGVTNRLGDYSGPCSAAASRSPSFSY